ncbi:MAG: purine-nucleoside phosphorylase [Kiritimatiellae bacterium]|jgi:purine-nucleoside phosphorylase|nr:purine-nucleoside phosphorylase [Kiritimatiellia bacterium]
MNCINSEIMEEITNPFPGEEIVCATVLGSGWGEAIENFNIIQKIDYSDIPLLGQTTVIGHAGSLLLIEHEGRKFIVFQGRRHFYENKGWLPVLVPVLMCIKMGIKNILLTNAGGGLSENMSPSDVMVISDHINMMGCNPLMMIDLPDIFPMFSDQSYIYCKELQNKLFVSAVKADLQVHKGVYLAVTGPTFETPAEIRAYKTMGASAVGMSTVPTAMVANAAGLKVAGMTCISNLGAGLSPNALTHEEVSENVGAVIPKMAKMLGNFWAGV